MNIYKMWMNVPTETRKAIKMFFRTMLLAIIPVAISGINDGVPVREFFAALGIALLMAINTYINAHPVIESKGVLPLS